MLARYDREVRAESTDDYLDITNAVSLLWRLEQQGVAVGAALERARRARPRRMIDDHCCVFADLHYPIALAAVPATRRIARWRRRRAARMPRARATARAGVLAEIGLALGDAALAHRRGD